jgi:hypothetical protein
LRGVNPDYPPVVFTCGLEAELKRQLGDAYDPDVVARQVQLTPLTFNRILRGCGVKLENALRLSKLVGKSVDELWRLK